MSTSSSPRRAPPVITAEQVATYRRDGFLVALRGLGVEAAWATGLACRRAEVLAGRGRASAGADGLRLDGVEPLDYCFCRLEG